jgi:hypothetical protein
MKFLAGLMAILFATLSSLRAKDLDAADSSSGWRENFEKGKHEASVGAGVFFSPFGASKSRPTENYAGPLVQIGYMLNRPDHGAEWRGNFEVLGELSGAGDFEGSGNYVASTTFWLRYNVVPPKWDLVPYLQIGGGVSLTDIDHKIFGQAFNFNLDAAVGFRYFVKPDCSLNAEYRFQHISNANMAEHNLGINAQAPVVSVSWYF